MVLNKKHTYLHLSINENESKKGKVFEMKKEYISPEIEIIRMSEDIFTMDSGTGDGEYGLPRMPI